MQSRDRIDAQAQELLMESRLLTGQEVHGASRAHLPANASNGPRRFAHIVSPLLLYAFFAAAILWPFRSPHFRPTCDLEFAIAFIIDGGNALHEGQFPIRVAPRQQEGLRYPVFQYYGNFPYTLAGLLYLAGCDPYLAWKIVSFLALVGGAYFTQRCAQILSGRRLSSIIAGCVLLTAPYLFTDVDARGAFSEYVAFCLLPVALYFSLRRFASTRTRYLFLAAVAWTLVGLSHNVTYLYGVLFVGLFFLSSLGWNHKSVHRFIRLAGAGVLHGLLIAWYFLPQVDSVRLLSVSDIRSNAVAWFALVLNPLPILLAPVLRVTAYGSATPGLGLQVGWPILAALLLGLAALFLRGLQAGRRMTLLRLAVLLVIALFMAWTPFDFWRHLPRALWFVQFPYRLLMFVVLWGSLLAACALAAWFPRLPFVAALICLLLLGVASASYLPPPRPLLDSFVARQMAHPDIGVAAQLGYLVSPDVIAQTSWSKVNPDFSNWKVRLDQVRAQPMVVERSLPLAAAKSMRIGWGGTARCRTSTSRPTLFEVPVLYYPRTLDVRDNGKHVRYGNIGRFVALRLGPGDHKISVRYAGITWANVVSALAWLGVILAAILALIRRVRPR
jgi:hypothetical protein